MVGTSFTHYPGDLIDARFNNYLLEHAHLFFSGQLDSFWNAPFMFPEKEVISYSDNLLGTAPFYSLFRYLGCDRETAFQAWYVFLSILNYSACYVFLFVVFRNRYSAVIGAFIFTFSLALHAQLGHAQTFPRFAIPLSFLMGYFYLRDLRPIYFFATLLFLIYQIYCGIYIGFMLIVPVALFLLFSLYYRWDIYKTKLLNVKWWGLMLSSIVINILLLMPLILPYLERTKSVSYYPYEQVSKALLTPLVFFFSWKGSLLWDFLSEIGVHIDWYNNFQVFPGGIATLSLICFIIIFIGKHWLPGKFFQRFEFKPILQLLFWLSVLTFLLFMRFGEVTLFKLIFQLPGFGSLRAIQRIITIELFFYAIAVAFLFSYLFKRNTRATAILFTLCLVASIVDNYVRQDHMHRHEKAENQARVNLLMSKLQNIPKGSVISYEPDSIISDINDYHLDAMLAAQSLNLISLNGYSATSPQGYDQYWIKPIAEYRLFWLTYNQMSNQKVYVVK